MKPKKKIERRLKRRSLKRINFQIKQKSDYNIKFGEIYQRIHYLLSLAISLYNSSPNLAKMYISIMRDIIKKNALRADSKFKKLICHNCNNLIFIDQNTIINLESEFYF